MDSCHLFNFLFGTKRAASELSKCFSSTNKDRRRKLQDDKAAACGSRTPPPSPLKQFQMKISNLVVSSRRKTSAKSVDHRGPECDERCGTYRASLVEFNDETTDVMIENSQTEEEIEGDVTLTPSTDTYLNCSGTHQATHQESSTDKVDAKFKRLILYDDNSTDEQSSPILASVAEVYNVVSSIGDARARLRRISSVSYDLEIEPTSTCTESGPEPVSDHFQYEKQTEKDTLGNGSGQRSLFVRNLVQSIESKANPLAEHIPLTPRKISNPSSISLIAGFSKPTTIVKPLPPKTPPKSSRAKCLTHQISLNKPTKIAQLFADDKFLRRFFFDKLDPIDRCVAAQVCRKWRSILYSDQSYWRDLVSVIDCTQLRREHLLECIFNTLQSAKLKQQKQVGKPANMRSSHDAAEVDSKIVSNCKLSLVTQDTLADFDNDDIWRIQELCNRFSSHQRVYGCKTQTMDANNNILSQDQQTACSTSKSSSIPSQISSTFSSMSLSSLFSPLSESSRIESLKDKLYASIYERGFDAICLFGATDADIDDLIIKLPEKAQHRIYLCKLHNCCISNKALELLTEHLNQIQELELSGCNEITNSFNLQTLKRLRCLIITDCINIADGLAQRLAPLLGQLDELTLQAYHLTDTFVDYLSLNAETARLTRLELPNCKEITNQSLATLALHFTNLNTLSISGSTKITDEGVEILAEKLRNLKCLDLSWCTRITDSSLECIACDLGDTLTDLVLDRNVHITDAGLGYLTMMTVLSLLHIRWCPRITDMGLESVIQTRTLRYLSLAGLHQITARSLLCLVETNLLELELTNCPAINGELIMFLASRMPQCNIVF